MLLWNCAIELYYTIMLLYNCVFLIVNTVTQLFLSFAVESHRLFLSAMSKN